VVTAKQAALYLSNYLTLYRSEYERFIAAPPMGLDIRHYGFLHTSIALSSTAILGKMELC
jgi:hypothetical protein